MNQRIRELMFDAGLNSQYVEGFDSIYSKQLEKFAELLKQAIYDEIKQELISDEHIDAEAKIEDRFYLHGCNGGIVDALTIIKNFGVELEQDQ